MKKLLRVYALVGSMLVPGGNDRLFGADRLTLPESVQSAAAVAERRLGVGLYRSAIELATERIRGLDYRRASLSTSFHRFAMVLASGYFESGDYAKATEWALQCESFMDRFPETFPIGCRERDELAILRSRIMEAEGRFTDAETLLRTVLSRRAGFSQRNSVGELDLMSRLGTILYVAQKRDELKTERIRIASAFCQLQVQFDRRLITLDTYDKAVRRFAGYLSDTGKVDESRRHWQTLIGHWINSDTFNSAAFSVRRSTIRDKIAEIDLKQGRAHKALVHLSRGLVGLIASYSLPTTMRVERIERAVRLGSTWRRLASCVNGLAPPLKAIDDATLTIDLALRLEPGTVVRRLPINGRGVVDSDQLAVLCLEKSHTQYGYAIEQIRRVSFETHLRIDDYERIQSLESATAKGLTATLQQLSESTDLSAVTTDCLVRTVERLLSLSHEQLVGSDPRIYRTKTLLGQLYVQNRQNNQAWPLLESAKRYWMPRTRSEPRMAAQTVHLLAGIYASRGLTTRAIASYRQAMGICAAPAPLVIGSEVAHVNRLGLHAELKLAQLFAAIPGRRSEAEKTLDSVEHRARSLGMVSERNLAIRSRAMMFESRLEWDKAIEEYDRLLRLVDTNEPIGRSASLKLVETRIAKLHAPKTYVDISIEDELSKIEDLLSNIEKNQGTGALELQRLRAMMATVRAVDSNQTRPRDDAKRAWREVISASPPHSVERALAHHNLALLRFSDWQADFEKWKKSQAARTRKKDSYRERLEQFERSLKKYKQDCLVYDKSRDRALLKKLKDDKESLDKRRTKLEGEYNLELARSVKSHRLALFEQILDEADESATNAVRILRDSRQCREPHLLYVALGNRAVIGFAVWRVIIEKQSDVQVRNCLCDLEMAVGLLENWPSGEFGRFVDRSSFVNQNPIANDLLEEIADERVGVASSGVREKAGNLLDRITSVTK